MPTPKLDEKAQAALTKQVNQALQLEAEASNIIIQAKEAQKKIDDFWAGVKTGMQEHNLKELTGSFGKVVLVPTTTLVAADIDKVDEKFLKKTLDTKKAHAALDLEGELPAGVEERQTVALRKYFKKGE